MYGYDSKIVSSLQRRERSEKGELKNEGYSHDVIENTCRKMSVLATPTIFMKTSDLSRHSHDSHENKGGCAPGQNGRKQRMRDEKGERPLSRKSKPELPKAHAHELNASNPPRDRRRGPESAPPWTISGRGAKKMLEKIRSKPECL
jgi:hypothetical protein